MKYKKIYELNKLSFKLNQKKIEEIEKYLELVRKVSSRISLVSKKDVKILFEKHFTDSLLFLKVLKGKKIVDIGSGAGFPGIPLAIVKENWNFILIERNKKKAEFLKKVKREIDLKNVKIFDDDLEKFETEDFCEYVSRGAGYRKILNILQKRKLKGFFYPILPEKEKNFKFIKLKNPFTNKEIKIGIIEI